MRYNIKDVVCYLLCVCVFDAAVVFGSFHDYSTQYNIIRNDRLKVHCLKFANDVSDTNEHY